MLDLHLPLLEILQVTLQFLDVLSLVLHLLLHFNGLPSEYVLFELV